MIIQNNNEVPIIKTNCKRIIFISLDHQKENQKLNDSKDKSENYSTNPNSAIRGVTKSNILSNNESRQTLKKTPITNGTIHMNDSIKDEVEKRKSPLLFRFRAVQSDAFEKAVKFIFIPPKNC